MSAKTEIQWTDATWNPVVGCTQVSPGCAHCYAKSLHDMRHAAHLAGKQLAPQYAQPFEVVQLKPERLTAPLSWRKPRRVFVNSVSDLFHDDVPDAYIDRVFAVMALASRHTFQVLTKRPARMQYYMTRLGSQSGYDRLQSAARELGYTLRFENIPLLPWPLPNVWLGVSVENQRFADERIPLLLQTPAAVRFLSCEPLLGPIDLNREWGAYQDGNVSPFRSRWINGIDWVIIGGESGKGARRFHLPWAERIVDDCVAAGVPKFMKQIGALATCGDFIPQPYSIGGHGDDMERWPTELRVREFPDGAALSALGSQE